MIFLSLQVTADAEGGFTGVWGRLATNKHAPGIYRRIACRYPTANFLSLAISAIHLGSKLGFCCAGSKQMKSAVITSLLFWGFLISPKFFRNRG